MQAAHLLGSHACGDMQHFNADHLTVGIEVQNDAWSYFLRRLYCRLTEADIQRVRFRVDVDPQGSLRSKNSVTTEGGSDAEFTTTRSQRPSNASIGVR
jgi:hypothetical protein